MELGGVRAGMGLSEQGLRDLGCGDRVLQSSVILDRTGFSGQDLGGLKLIPATDLEQAMRLSTLS